MEIVTRKVRLSGDALKERHRLEAQEKLERAAAADAAIDEKIRRNIELYGP